MLPRTLLTATGYFFLCWCVCGRCGFKYHLCNFAVPVGARMGGLQPGRHCSSSTHRDSHHQQRLRVLHPELDRDSSNESAAHCNRTGHYYTANSLFINFAIGSMGLKVLKGCDSFYVSGKAQTFNKGWNLEEKLGRSLDKSSP
eukprot:Gb_31328 [translate_table: standard]